MPGLLLCIKGDKMCERGGPFRFLQQFICCVSLAYRTYYNTGILQKPLSEDKEILQLAQAVIE